MWVSHKFSYHCMWLYFMTRIFLNVKVDFLIRIFWTFDTKDLDLFYSICGECYSKKIPGNNKLTHFLNLYRCGLVEKACKMYITFIAKCKRLVQKVINTPIILDSFSFTHKMTLLFVIKELPDTGTLTSILPFITPICFP